MQIDLTLNGYLNAIFASHYKSLTYANAPSPLPSGISTTVVRFHPYFYTMDEHRFYLEKCLELAKQAAKQGESPVGSLLVKDGMVIGEAYEKSKQLKDIVLTSDSFRSWGPPPQVIIYTTES